MTSDGYPREPEETAEGFDAPYAIDPGSASSALEDLLGRASEECSGMQLDELTALLEAACDQFAAGNHEEGAAGLTAFENRVEDLREAGTMSCSFAGKVLSLSEAAIAWAADGSLREATEESRWLDGTLPGEDDLDL